MRFAFSSLLALLLLASCRSGDDVTQDDEGLLRLGSEEARAVVERAVRLDDRTLVLDAEAGSITIVGTDDDVARLRFEQVARGASEAAARERLGRLSIEEVGDAEVYRFVLRTNGVAGARVNVEARVPRDAALRVQLERGTARLSGTAGSVAVELESGAVEAAGLAGRQVALRTQLGNVEAGFAALPAEADVHVATKNGNVVLTLPADANAGVDVETQTGTISVQGLAFTDQSLDQNGVRQRFRGRLGQGGARVGASTDVGTIALNEGRLLELDDLDLFDPATADTTVVPRGAPVAPSDD